MGNYCRLGMVAMLLAIPPALAFHQLTQPTAVSHRADTGWDNPPRPGTTASFGPTFDGDDTGWN
jgi:hypothetical protein